MKFCYIKDLDIPWFVGMVERSQHLPSTVAYDDTCVWLIDNELHQAATDPRLKSPWELPSPWGKKVKFNG